MQRETFTLVVHDTCMLTPTIRQVAFVREDGKPLDFIPGQFITFHFELDNTQHQRSYSIASIPGKSGFIEIAVSPFEGGPGTKLLFNAKLGDKIETSGPFGRLVLRDEQPKRYILIATGTGVTPYRAMLPELSHRLQRSDSRAVILLGVQSPEQLLYGQNFIDYASKQPKLEFHAFYSRVMPTTPTDYEHQGYVQTAFEWLNLNPENDIIYLCGNPDMIDDAFMILRKRGFETRQVRREKYISPKR